MTRHPRRATRALLLIGLSSALAAWAPGAHASPNGDRAAACTAGSPDLVVTDADVTGRPFAFHGTEGEQFVWRFTAETKNVCRTAAVASRTGVRLTALHHAARDYMTATRAVPALAGGESAQGTPSYDYRMRGAPADAYGIEVCADVGERVDESNELNNCRNVPGHLYIANKVWKGSLNGSAALGPGLAKESWQSTGAKLTFDKYIGSGTFTYVFSGDVTWRASGNAGECTISGGPATATVVGEPEVIVNYNEYAYSGMLEWTGGTFYDINIRCPFVPPRKLFPGPARPVFLLTPFPTKLSRTEEELVGRNYSPTKYTTWNWNFQPGWK